jgi:hypothetical protein
MLRGSTRSRHDHESRLRSTLLLDITGHIWGSANESGKDGTIGACPSEPTSIGSLSGTGSPQSFAQPAVVDSIGERSTLR